MGFFRLRFSNSRGLTKNDSLKRTPKREVPFYLFAESVFLLRNDETTLTPVGLLGTSNFGFESL